MTTETESNEIESQIVEQAFIRHVHIVPHDCVVCGKAFLGPVKRAYCSVSCRRRRAYERQLDKAGKPGPQRRFMELKDWSQVHGG